MMQQGEHVNDDFTSFYLETSHHGGISLRPVEDRIHEIPDERRDQVIALRTSIGHGITHFRQRQRALEAITCVSRPVPPHRRVDTSAAYEAITRVSSRPLPIAPSAAPVAITHLGARPSPLSPIIAPSMAPARVPPLVFLVEDDIGADQVFDENDDDRQPSVDQHPQASPMSMSMASVEARVAQVPATFDSSATSSTTAPPPPPPPPLDSSTDVQFF